MSIDHPQRGCNCPVHMRRRTRDRISPKHRARRRKNAKEYYHTHKEQQLRNAKKWREEHPERFKGLMQRHRLRLKHRRHDEQFI